MKYILQIEDFQAQRQPQVQTEYHLIGARTAADALVIGGVNHNVPLTEGEGASLHTRKLVQLEAR